MSLKQSKDSATLFLADLKAINDELKATKEELEASKQALEAIEEALVSSKDELKVSRDELTAHLTECSQTHRIAKVTIHPLDRSGKQPITPHLIPRIQANIAQLQTKLDNTEWELRR